MTLFRSTFVELFSPFFLTFSITSFVLIMQRLYTLVRLMVEKLFTVQDVGHDLHEPLVERLKTDEVNWCVPGKQNPHGRPARNAAS